jgi:hypothetical protein
MEQSNKAFSAALVKSLRGERGHLPIKNALSDIDVALAGKHRVELPYSIYQLVKHMTYWQDFLLLAAQDKKTTLPVHGRESWPGETPGGVLRNIASHNSSHLGEIVLIRRLFSAWPPPIF